MVVTRIGERRERDLRLLLRQIKKAMNGKAFLPIKGSLATHPAEGKYQRAIEMAARFPEICWRLPLKRKPWESEPYPMSIFEALAVAVAYGDRPS